LKKEAKVDKKLNS